MQIPQCCCCKGHSCNYFPEVFAFSFSGCFLCSVYPSGEATRRPVVCYNIWSSKSKEKELEVVYSCKENYSPSRRNNSCFPKCIPKNPLNFDQPTKLWIRSWRLWNSWKACSDRGTFSSRNWILYERIKEAQLCWNQLASNKSLKFLVKGFLFRK